MTRARRVREGHVELSPGPAWGPVLRSWHARPDVTGVLLLLGLAYVRGWRRVRRQGHGHVASWWHVAAYLAGLASIALALLSPLDALAEVLFSAHMIQHQLLLMVAPPLLLLGNPFPFILWGVPQGLRRGIGRAFTPRRALRAGWRGLTGMPVAGALYTACLWGWHHPVFYEAALRSRLVHDLEHVTFFGTAVLFWWPIINPAPRLRDLTTGGQYGWRIAYVILATGLNTLLGSVIGMAERVVYPSYAAMPRVFGESALDDQALGGGIMWSASHMFLIALLVLLSHAMDAGERRASRRPTARQAADPPPPGT